MKIKFIIFLVISTLLAVAGGAYLLIMNERRIADADYLIMLHEVEIMRGRLLLDIRAVESDLYSQSSRHPASIDAIVSDVGMFLDLLAKVVEGNREIYGVTVAFEPYTKRADAEYFAPYF